MSALYNDERPSIFVIPNPLSFLAHKGRTIGSYLAGGLVALGWWIFIDAVIQASSDHTDDAVKMGFEDWFSGILTSLGMLVINLIDKSRLQGEAFSYAGSNLVWKARLFLFLGFALIAGGFAGSVCVLIIKYVVNHDSAQPYLYYGVAAVVQCTLLMFSSAILWVAQSTQEEYEYNVRL
ncbi:uncharacterized protein BYT42DRAFT_587728 [Radiomyces spectabilis]|uniref:uncharacterized protein n=1 Tax=Radiomyces spectabilis TaxID=64574 RepID=UPI002220B970|nr:uncharacterized protein BYT42DRAFT_587728 [Radiomyces spectabilis]KAI8366742.1 hypothetical protein BYT42DRAFT_587728 [Radiomyces spectabilis]